MGTIHPKKLKNKIKNYGHDIYYQIFFPAHDIIQCNKLLTLFFFFKREREREREREMGFGISL